MRAPQLRGLGLSNHQGFSLIEAAIVLALIGLVLGGIWAAASAVRFSNKSNGLANDLIGMSEDMIAKGGRFWGDQITYNSQMQSVGIVPPAYRLDGSGGYYKDPYFGYWASVVNQGANRAVSILVENPAGALNPAICTRLAQKLTAWMRTVGQTRALGNNLQPHIDIYNDDGLAGIFYAGQSVSLTTIKNACNAPSGAWSISIYRPY